MSIKQIPSPDLSTLAIAGVDLQYLEAVGFSDDSQHLVVKATFTESGGDGTLRYGYFLYDLANETFSLNFNELLFAGSRVNSSNVESFSFQGNADDYTVIATIKDADATASRLVYVDNGVVQSSDVLTEVLGDDFNIVVEHQLLDESGRFLAIQTTDSSLASDLLPDTNDSPDIYLVDLVTMEVTRVSEIGGAERNEPTYLQDIRLVDNHIEIAFTTDAYYVSPSKVDLNSLDLEGPLGTRTDAYVWQAELDNSGALAGSVKFNLLSNTTEAVASGFVDQDAGVSLSNDIAYFSSNSALLIDNDTNDTVDTFAYENGNISRLSFSGEEFDLGSTLVDSNASGRYVLVLSLASQVSGTTGAQQLVFIDTQTGDGRVVSENTAGSAGDNFTTNGVISNNGAHVAFTSLASNLTNELPEAFAGSLYYREYDDINSLPTGNITLDGLPIPGKTIELNFDNIADNDGVGEFSVQWFRDNELIFNADDNALTLTNDDIDKALSAIVSYTDNNGNDEVLNVDAFNPFPRAADTQGNIDFTAKYIVSESSGENLFEFDIGFDEINFFGQATLFSGSSAVDAIKVSTGQVLDFTNVKSSIDKVYLPGNLSDYLQHADLDTDTGVMTLISTANFTYTEVKFIATNVAADELVFSDGKVSTASIKTYLAAAEPSLDTLNLSTSETYATVVAQTNTAKVKAIALDDNGENFTSFSPGIELQVSGGAGVDQVYIQAGTTVDATNLKSSIDVIYLQGEWADYTKSFDASGNFVLSRSVLIDGSEHLESVAVASGSTVATNDLLVFADGSIRSKQAVTAVRAENTNDFDTLAGFDGSITTPIENLAGLDLIFPSEAAGKLGSLDSLFVGVSEQVDGSDIDNGINGVNEQVVDCKDAEVGDWAVDYGVLMF
jgi:hypothetical protein